MLTKYKNIIGDRAFHEVKLEKITGTEFITKIEGRAFKWLNVENINLPNVTEIGEYAFEASNVKYFNFGNNLMCIKNQVFVNTKQVNRMYIPNGVNLVAYALYV